MSVQFPPSSSIIRRDSSASYLQRLQQACRETVAQTGALASCLWLWDDELRALQIVAHHQLDAEYLAYGNQVSRTAIAQERAPVYQACRQGVPVAVHGPMRDEAFAYFTHEFAHLGFETIYVEPILLEYTAVGCLALYFERHHEPDKHQALELRLAVSQVATTVTEHAHGIHLAGRIKELEELNAAHVANVQTLKELSRLKSDLLGILSHELRTPLAIIVGYTGILQGHAAERNDFLAIDYLERLENGSKRLMRLIEDGMTVSSIENGQLLIEPEDCDLDDLIGQVIDALGPGLRQKEVSLEYTGPQEPATAVLDSRRILQVITNLLENALKFSPRHATIQVELSCTGAQLRMVIRDQGIGISPKQLPLVFEKYFQGDSSLNRPHEGVGLGLMIARSIIEAHGGSITVESVLGEGTEFVVLLPRDGSRPGEDIYAAYPFEILKRWQ